MSKDVHGTGSPRSSLTPGTTISHYQILRPLGAGGMGEVYLATDISLQRPVALKLLLPELCDQPNPRKRFVREAQTVASIDHPNIIGIHDVGEHLDRPYFTMPYVNGRTLAQYIQAGRPSLSDMLDIALAICTGLQAAHDRGIIHRDLKPGNIMIDQSRHIFLLDFGLAIADGWPAEETAEDTLTRLTLAGVPVGTVAYMAPEQLRGHPPSTQADIFALGVTLFELASGVYPFTVGSLALTASSILRDEPRSLLEHNPSVPPDYIRIVGRCLKKDPGRRFQTVHDVRNELEDLKESLGREHPAVGLSASLDARPGKLAEKEFPIGADLVRSLATRTPRMIGDVLTYLDNEIASDTLVIYLHGMGLDERSLAEVLRSIPCRAIAPSLYGFGLYARHRIPLPLADHSILIRALMAHVMQDIVPQKVLLVGVSSGSDHVLQMLSADRSMADEIAGLLLMGCNLDLRTCFNSQIFANLYAESPAETLAAVRAAGERLATLEEWLLVHAYLVQVMQKFATDIEALRQYAADIVQPIQARGLDQFVDWYRLSCESVAAVRFVFFVDEAAPLNDLLQRHLDTGVLGEHGVERTIIREPLAHMELLSPYVIVRHTLKMLSEIE